MKEKMRVPSGGKAIQGEAMRGLIFTSDSINAMLRKVNPKTQTRRLSGLQVVNAEPERYAVHSTYTDPHGEVWGQFMHADVRSWKQIKCPWHVGELIYAKETWRISKAKWGSQQKALQIQYRADMSLHWIPVVKNIFMKYDPIKYAPVDRDTAIPWRSPLFMPKWAARPELIRPITGIRCERVQDISEEDCVAEGIQFDGRYWRSVVHPIKGTLKYWPDANMAYEKLWNSLHALPKAVRANNYWAKALGWDKQVIMDEYSFEDVIEALPEEIVGYISFPFSAEDGDHRETIRGKPHHRCVNCWAWVLTLGGRK